MSLLDSTTASEAAFKAGLTAAQTGGQASTNDPTASEHWPYAKSVPGGDETTFGKLIGLDRAGVPSTQASLIQLGAIMPVADVWTGDPLGVRWDLPTAAVQNAAGDFVVPSADAAKAAEADATYTDGESHDKPGHLQCQHHGPVQYQHHSPVRLQQLPDAGELSARADERPARRQGAGVGPVHPVRGRQYRAGGHHGAGGARRPPRPW